MDKQDAQSAVSSEIARRQAKRATGAIKGIRKVVPPKPRPPMDMSPAAVARRAQKREYYQRNKDAINAAKRASRKASVKRMFTYFPSIRQARDIRSSGDKLEEYRQQVTNSLMIWDDNHAVAVAHNTDEQKIDIALQEARQPTGQHYNPAPNRPAFTFPPLHNGIDLGSHVDTMYEVLPPITQ